MLELFEVLELAQLHILHLQVLGEVIDEACLARECPARGLQPLYLNFVVLALDILPVELLYDADLGGQLMLRGLGRILARRRGCLPCVRAPSASVRLITALPHLMLS